VAVTAVVDPETLTWIQEDEHDLDRRAVQWRLLPDHHLDRLQASGTHRFVTRADGTDRLTDGDVKVQVPLFGGRVESALAAGLAEHLDAEVPVVDRWITDQG
jgi:Protein of unknown function (DUF2505)